MLKTLLTYKAFTIIWLASRGRFGEGGEWIGWLGRSKTKTKLKKVVNIVAEIKENSLDRYMYVIEISTL